MSDNKVFFDHVSTTPCDQRVVDAMLPYFTERFGNPSSHVHEAGVLAAQGVDLAREQVAALVNAKPFEVIFTSGATEANNLALLGIPGSGDTTRKHILISQIEHFSIVNTAAMLRAHGYTVEEIPVDDNGVVTPQALEAKLTDDTLLVSVMHANAEIGTIQPIAELAKLAHAKGALFHTDATISAGLLPLDMHTMELDAITLSAHNFYGPKGVGALVLRDGLRPRARSYGGWQEKGLRCGTENVPGIVGMGAAAALATEEGSQRAAHLHELGKMLKEGLAEKIRFIRFTGHDDLQQRLPGHVSFWVEHVEGESLILFLNVKGVMAASGSACSSNLKADDEDGLVSSHVLAAVGVPTDICAGSVAFSLGKDNTKDDVEKTLAELPPIVERLLSMSPSYADYVKANKGEGS